MKQNREVVNVVFKVESENHFRCVFFIEFIFNHGDFYGYEACFFGTKHCSH